MRTATDLPSPFRPSARPTLLAAGSLVFLVGLVFHPMVGFEFVDLDVPEQVIENEHVHGLTYENLVYVLTSRCTKSYYPVRTLTFAVDYEMWGLNPGGFKLTNGLIHLVNVLLVFWLILRLLRRSSAPETPDETWWDVAAAAFGAGIFAVHPLVVEPVAWVSGREELLMTLGALGAIHFHLAARGLEDRGARRASRLACHAGTVLCCAAACLSNAVGAVIPLLITAWDLLTLPRPRARKILCSTAPLWGIAVATIVIKKLGGVDTATGAPAMFSPTWLMLVLNVFWLNLRTLVWPTELAVHYAWPMPDSFLDAEVVLGGSALGLTSIVLWSLWRRKLVLLLFGLCCFGLALGPTSAVLPHHICRADRFLYLPLVGVAVALGVGLRPLGKFCRGRRCAGAAAGVLLLLGAAWLSATQVDSWQNSLSLWENALRVNPDNPYAHSCLARSLAAGKQFRRSIQHYEEALRTSPVQAHTLADFAWVLATCDDLELRDYDRALQLAEWASTASQWKNREILRKYAKVHCGFAEHLAARGETERTVRHYMTSIDADPNFDVPLLNLALIFITSPEEQFRRPDAAVRLAERGCQLTASPDAQRLAILAAAYSQAKRFDEAVAAVEKALPLARAAADFLLVEDLEHQLGLYRNRTAFEP
ncbi:MAG: hypothetical protein HQ582_14660 [Planctomycetes bacterium]|nr:hypothetical protein [Planctomycetota bacterium]